MRGLTAPIASASADRGRCHGTAPGLGAKRRISSPVQHAKIPAPSRAARTLEGKIVTAEHARFDEARRAWNLTIDQRPSAVVFPESARDVAAAVLFAREHGQRIAAQGTGHNAGPLGSLDDTLLPRPSACAACRSTAPPALPASRPASSGLRSSRPPPGTVSRRSPDPPPTSG